MFYFFIPTSGKGITEHHAWWQGSLTHLIRGILENVHCTGINLEYP